MKLKAAAKNRGTLIKQYPNADARRAHERGKNVVFAPRASYGSASGDRYNLAVGASGTLVGNAGVAISHTSIEVRPPSYVYSLGLFGNTADIWLRGCLYESLRYLDTGTIL